MGTGDEEERNYLIWDSRKGPSDMAWFWRPEGRGYTPFIEEAGRYTLAEATSHRDTDIAVPVELAMTISARAILLDNMHQHRHATKVRQGSKRRARP